jgi:hypothetical protein
MVAPYRLNYPIHSSFPCPTRTIKGQERLVRTDAIKLLWNVLLPHSPRGEGSVQVFILMLDITLWKAWVLQ